MKRFVRVHIENVKSWRIGYCLGDSNSYVMVEMVIGEGVKLETVGLYRYEKETGVKFLYAVDIPLGMDEGTRLNGFIWGLTVEARRSA